MNLLLVEDDLMLAETVCDGIRQHAWGVDHVSDAVAAKLALVEHAYAAVLLDLGLPGDSGLTVLKWMRERYDSTPVIIMTARGQLSERIRGLDAGADDYVVKPFDRKILLARVKAVLRRGLPVTEGRDFDGLRIDEPSRTATLRGKALDLTAGEFSLLVRLVAHRGRVFARPPDERTVDVQVANLRRKLGRWGDHIETVRGVGYRISEFGQ